MNVTPLLLALAMPPSATERMPLVDDAIAIPSVLEARDTGGKPLSGFVQRDHIGGRLLPIRFLARISPGQEPYGFLILPGAEDCRQETPRRRCLAGTIEVFKASRATPIQRILAYTHSGAGNLLDFFAAVDVNFDGHLDLRVMDEFGGKWARHHYWIFDPATSRFVKTALARDLERISAAHIEADAARRRILVKEFWGACFPDRYEFVVESGRLRLMESWELEPGPHGCAETRRRTRPRHAPAVGFRQDLQ